MKQFTRILCALLCAATLATGVACSNPSDEKTTGKTTEGATVKEEETADPFYTDDLDPSVKYTGQKVSMIAYNGPGVSDELKADGSNGETVNDAVYERNQTVFDRLGIELEINLQENNEDVSDKADKCVSSGSGDYDIVSNSTMRNIQYVAKNNFLNLNNVETINLEKKYWAQGFNDIASYEDKQFLATGAIAISQFRYMFVTIYNKKLFQNHGIQDLYETVLDGTWTIEKQTALIKDTYQGNGNAGKDADGFYGLITGNIVSIDPYWVAAQCKLIAKNEDGDWVFGMSSDLSSRMSDTVSALQTMFYTSNGAYVFNGADHDDTGKTDIIKMFAAEQGLMATVQLYALETNNNDMGFDFGIAPIPKFNEEQQNYASYVQDQVTSYGILTSVGEGRYEVLGAFLECMASESYKTVVYAYYTKALSLKFLRNEESIAMLNLIYDSIQYDFVGAFSNILVGYEVRDRLRVQVSQRTNKVVSTMKSIEKQVNGMLRKFNESLSALE